MGARQKKKKKKLEKKTIDPLDKFRRKPWLQSKPSFFVTRFMWDANPPNWTYATEELKHPVEHVVLNYHSRIPACSERTQCKMVIQSMQQYQCKVLRYQDLAYNWYIGGDGRVYEGRGWKKHPKLQHDLSTECLEIAFMGDFPFKYDPPEHMVKTFDEVIKYGIEKEFIKEDYQFHQYRTDAGEPSATLTRAQ